MRLDSKGCGSFEKAVRRRWRSWGKESEPARPFFRKRQHLLEEFQTLAGDSAQLFHGSPRLVEKGEIIIEAGGSRGNRDIDAC